MFLQPRLVPEPAKHRRQAEPKKFDDMSFDYWIFFFSRVVFVIALVECRDLCLSWPSHTTNKEIFWHIGCLVHTSLNNANKWHISIIYRDRPKKNKKSIIYRDRRGFAPTHLSSSEPLTRTHTLWSSMEFSRTSSFYLHLLILSTFLTFLDRVTLELIH